MEASVRPSVVILGGGIGGVEAMLALRDLAGDLADVTLVSPEPEFVLKPLAVEEPFLLKPPDRHDLAAAAKACGANFVLSAARRVAPRKRTVELANGSELPYDHLVVALGARSRPALAGSDIFWAGRSDLPIDELIKKAAASQSRSLALVVPAGISWSLPLYELALQSRSRADLLGHAALAIDIYSPEETPLAIFGPGPSDAVAQVLSGRRIGFHGGATVDGSETGSPVIRPGGARLEAGAVISIPLLVGPGLPGLPTNAEGFLPIDPTCRVYGCTDVYAVGDGASFPVKQGGIATQMADVVAQRIAASCGADVRPEPFHPVLRGRLIAGEESLFLSGDLSGGHGEGKASPDYLWWPPGKVSGRYLTPWLNGLGYGSYAEPPCRPIDLEVPLKDDWRCTPVAMGSSESRARDGNVRVGHAVCSVIRCRTFPHQGYDRARSAVGLRGGPWNRPALKRGKAVAAAAEPAADRGDRGFAPSPPPGHRPRRNSDHAGPEPGVRRRCSTGSSSPTSSAVLSPGTGAPDSRLGPLMIAAGVGDDLLALVVEPPDRDDRAGLRPDPLRGLPARLPRVPERPTAQHWRALLVTAT